MTAATTTPVGKYGSDEQLPSSSGSDVQRQFAQMKARLVARYGLVAVPGRPEELVSPRNHGDMRRGVSLGYGCKTIRVRLMADRGWIRTEDFQIGDGWQPKFYEMSDTYFDYIGPDSLNRKPRPIKDNPQG